MKTGLDIINDIKNVESILGLTVPENGSYTENDVLSFSVQFSENVVVTGSPRLALTLGVTPQYATLVSGAGTDTLVFEYTVQAADLDADGIALNATIDLNSGTIKDATGKNAALLMTVPDLTGVLVDGTP